MCSPASAWAWWANRAAASPPSLGHHGPGPTDAWRHRPRRTGDLRARPHGDGAHGADGLPGPLRLAQPAPDRAPHLRRSVAPAWRRRPGRGRPEGHGHAGRGRPAARPCRPLSARILRRPAPADRHRPRPDPAAQAGDLRRAGVGARRVDPRPDHQPAARSQGRNGARLHHDQPRSRRGRACERPGRGDVSRPHRRAGRLAGDLRGPAPSLYARPDRGHSRPVPSRRRLGHGQGKGRDRERPQPAAGLPFQSALPLEGRPLRERGAGARGGRRGPPRGLSFPRSHESDRVA